MKATGYDQWNDPNLEATNSSGFNALPGGYINSDGWTSVGTGEGIGDYGYWWSTTDPPGGLPKSWNREQSYDSGNIVRGYYIYHYGFSARCIKD